jgi:selenide,water dikinase
MTFLNARASRVALDNGATGATDVTGFGLLGHLGRMAGESAVDVTIDVGSVPLIDGARALAEAGAISGGAIRNMNWVHEQLDRGGADELTVTLLADPQTSGGLLFGIDEANVEAALAALASSGHRAASVGRARRGSGRLVLR